jgi:hypothetical protein
LLHSLEQMGTIEVLDLRAIPPHYVWHQHLDGNCLPNLHRLILSLRDTFLGNFLGWIALWELPALKSLALIEKDACVFAFNHGDHLQFIEKHAFKLKYLDVHVEDIQYVRGSVDLRGISDFPSLEHVVLHPVDCAVGLPSIHPTLETISVWLDNPTTNLSSQESDVNIVWKDIWLMKRPHLSAIRLRGNARDLLSSAPGSDPSVANQWRLWFRRLEDTGVSVEYDDRTRVI